MRKTERSGCNSGFDNITHCQKRTSANKVKELADDCDIDTNIFNTKPKQCAELIRVQGGGLKTKSSSKKSPKKKVSSKKSPKKKVSSKKVSSKKIIPSKHADEYKKLNVMKKKDLSEFSGDITQGKQDGKLVSVNKLRKHELILAIINGKNPKRSSEKRKSKRFLINEITGMTGEKIKDKDYSYDEVLSRYNYLLKKERKKLSKLSKGKKESMINDRLDDLNDRHNMIQEISSITGKDPDFYKIYDPDEIIDILEYLRRSRLLNS